MNYIYKDNNLKNPLSLQQLINETNLIESCNFNEENFPQRIKGKLCNCEHGGQFLLYPINHESVIEGEKRYMKCLNCGEIAHL
jgi:hypothetical protein